MTRGRALAIGLALAGAFAAGLALFVWLSTRETYRMPSGSMEPTIHSGDRLVVDRGAYADRSPRPGEIVVFRAPFDEEKLFVERIAAVGPAEVDMLADGTLVVDQESVPREPAGEIEIDDGDGRRTKVTAWQETNGRSTYRVLWDPEVPAGGHPPGPWPVFPGKIFVLGDNRQSSHDSRWWGPLPRENLIGRVTDVFLSRDGDAVRSVQ